MKFAKKKSTRTNLGLLLFILVVFVASFGLVSAKEKQVVFRLGHAESAGGNRDKALNYFADLVAERTDNKVKINVYPASQLGSEREILDNIRMGTIEMGCIPTGQIATFNPFFSILDLPYLFTSQKQADQALDGEIGRKMKKEVEPYGLTHLGYFASGFRNVGNDTRAVNNVADLKGLKIRVPGWPSLISLFKNLGANPTPMDFNEVYLAVQTGVLDGLEVPVITFRDMKFYEVCKYYTLNGHSYTVMHLVMNSSKFKSLSAETQRIIMESAQEAFVYQRESLNEEIEETLDMLETKYGTVINRNPDMKEYQEAAEPIHKEFIKKHGKKAKEVMEGIKNL